MPTLLEQAGYKFFFTAKDRAEPPHVHVIGHAGAAKIWLVPEVRLQKSAGYSKRRRGQIIRIARKHKDRWLVAWSEYFGRG